MTCSPANRSGRRPRAGWQPDPADKACRGLLAAVPAGDGGVIATSVDHRSVQLWDLESGAPAGELAGLEATRLRGLAAARRPDGTPLIVTGDVDGQARWFDAATGGLAGGPVEPHAAPAASVLPVAAGGQVILAVQASDQVRLIDGRTCEPASGTWVIGCGNIAAAASPEGRIVLAAAAPEGRDITLFNWPSGSVSRLPGQGGTISAVAAAALPDGRVIIAGASWNGNLYRWDALAWRAGRRTVTRPLACRAGRHRGPAG